MKKLSNPRGYLSYTQVDLWLRSPTKYKEQYFYGNDEGIKNAYMDYGKATADAIESGVETGDALFDTAITLLTKYSKIEHEIQATLQTPYGSVDLLGKLDTFDPETLNFREYKTGKTIWTEHRAKKHRQLHHYQLLIWLKHGKISQNIALDWLETEKLADSSVAFTGKKRSFVVDITMVDVINYMSLVSTVAKEIDQEYIKEFNKFM